MRQGNTMILVSIKYIIHTPTFAPIHCEFVVHILNRQCLIVKHPIPQTNPISPKSPRQFANFILQYPFIFFGKTPCNL